MDTEQGGMGTGNEYFFFGFFVNGVFAFLAGQSMPTEQVF
jgi:hypothetical protein